MDEIVHKAIIWQEQENKVMFIRGNPHSLPYKRLPVVNNNSLILQKYLTRLYKFKLKYLRQLPDSWAKLLFLETAASENFEVFSIYSVVEDLGKSNYESHYNFAAVKDILNSDFSETDIQALNLFVDIYEDELE